MLNYGESSDFQSKFSSGALTRASEDETADSTESGIDPDSNSDTNSSGEFGFDEVGDADKKDSRFVSPDEEVASDDPAGGADRGTDKALEAASTGDTDDP